MKDKLQLLINSEANLTNSAFARMLEINPATISQILAGRNKPSYELLHKILLRFPNVSADWLMADRGEMLRDASLTPSGIPRSGKDLLSDAVDPVSDLISSEVVLPRTIGNAASSATAGIQGSIFDTFQTVDASRTDAEPSQSASAARDANATVSSSAVTTSSHSGVSVERVVIFYTDKTFDTYVPKK